jgi:hypothetical protein
MVDSNVLSRSLRVQGPLLDDGESAHANLRDLEKEIIKVLVNSAADKGTGSRIRNRNIEFNNLNPNNCYYAHANLRYTEKRLSKYQ